MPVRAVWGRELASQALVSSNLELRLYCPLQTLTVILIRDEAHFTIET